MKKPTLYLFFSLLLLFSFAYAQMDSKDPYAGIDKARKAKLEKLKKVEFIKGSKLKIEMQRLELDLKEMLLGGTDLKKIRKNCEQRGKLWAEIQYLQFETDAKIRKILTEKEWDRFIKWKKNLYKLKKEKYKKSNYWDKQKKKGVG